MRDELFAKLDMKSCGFGAPGTQGRRRPAVGTRRRRHADRTGTRRRQSARRRTGGHRALLARGLRQVPRAALDGTAGARHARVDAAPAHGAKHGLRGRLDGRDDAARIGARAQRQQHDVVRDGDGRAGRAPRVCGRDEQGRSGAGEFPRRAVRPLRDEVITGSEEIVTPVAQLCNAGTGRAS